MSVIRIFLGIAGGVVAAGTALRLRALSRERGVPAVELVHEIPEVVAGEARFIVEAAREAARDGMRAARDHESRLEQVLSTGRSSKEMP